VVRRVGDAISDHDYGGGCRRVNLGLSLMAGEQGSSVAWGVCPAIDASLLSLLGSAAAGLRGWDRAVISLLITVVCRVYGAHSPDLSSC
jgi:hypothetical protein